jgi:hypothetical protein
MQTVNASVILEDAYRLMRWDPDQLEDSEKGDGRNALSLALQQVWEAWWWEALMQCSRVTLAESFVSGGLASADIIYYWPDTDAFYVSPSGTGIDPADEDGDTNTSGWIKLSLTENVVRSKWDPDTVYSPGDEVTWDGVDYSLLGSDDSTGEEPGIAGSWQPIADWRPTVPYTNSSGTVVGPYGKIRTVSQLDPRATANPGEFDFEEDVDGTRLLNLTVTHPWVWSRRPTPILTGNDYSATSTYAATPVADLVFDS